MSKPFIVKCPNQCGVKILTENEYNNHTYWCTFCGKEMKNI